ncbi:MAG: Cro/Cl family transcriptional regulator [Deltaproteobacteria bacterium CG_4_8_14_3_um_filter_45_9]|nr:MAG: Cro/Cl family transcriptional regulator [Deltaproteobacteria bacterium CG03_land_8_20_14_0_80_45_14]PIX25729.1 MAG: Cro/Cl family transcriptional regulator [Deltaproteobacteria bacterium CG_4_8_14_3_um_filter_45_9]
MIEIKIAKKIRQLRLEQRMTQEMLANKTGFSKAFISKTENHKTSPSIASLSKIAIALGVSISTLLDENTGENQDIILVRRGHRKKIVGPGSDIGFSYESLAHKKKRKTMEPFIIKYPLGSHVQKLFEHEGEEMLFILKGKIKLTYGDKTFILREGDTAYFNPSIPHRGESVGKTEGVGLCVLVSPR